MKSLYLAAFAVILLSSCHTSSDVISGAKFQKRKYCKGWFTEKSSDAPKPETATTVLKANSIQQENETTNIPITSITTEENEDVQSQGDKHEELKVLTFKLQDTDNQVSDKTVVRIDDDYKPNFSEATAKKKKKKKEKIEPTISWGFSSSAVSTWFWGWSTLAFLNIPVIGIIFGALGIALCFAGLSKLKKPKGKKKKNLRMAIGGIVFGLLSLIVCLLILI